MTSPTKEFKPFDDIDKHHIRCNFFNRPREGCEMCDGLFKHYPYETPEDMAGLMKKHFPNNIVR